MFWLWFWKTYECILHSKYYMEKEWPNVTQGVHFRRVKESAVSCLRHMVSSTTSRNPHSLLFPTQTHVYPNTDRHKNTYWCIYGKHIQYKKTSVTESIKPVSGWHCGLPANVPLLRHSLMRLALRTWKALVISWFMKLSLFKTLATIIRRSNTSSSSAMVATCIRSPRPSSKLPVYRYWSTA